MEVCGSHTMALARTGVKQSLKEYVNLISGPGCPVCVTDQRSIDAMIALAEGENRVICTFGDMMRVPGSNKTLMDSKIAGKDIRVLYSPIDAIKVAEENPEKEVIFLGIGFETTIPILALMVGERPKTSREKLFNLDGNKACRACSSLSAGERRCSFGWILAAWPCFDCPWGEIIPLFGG